MQAHNTQVHADDDGYVRAPRGLAYRRLTDVGAWPRWWPGAAVTRLPGQSEAFEVVLRATPLGRPVRLQVRPHAWRHDEGFALDLAGDLEGRAEFWLEEGWGGTVVHHPLAAEVVRGRPAGVLARYRASLRRGLGGLKDDLEAEVRERLGMAP